MGKSPRRQFIVLSAAADGLSVNLLVDNFWRKNAAPHLLLQIWRVAMAKIWQNGKNPFLKEVLSALRIIF